MKADQTKPKPLKNSAADGSLPAVRTATPRESTTTASVVGHTDPYTIRLPPNGKERADSVFPATSIGTDGKEKIHDIRNLLSASFGASVEI